ncbi:MAG: epoxyqueuosine reductase QueH [Fastidiosipilaceae bacterium]
MNGTEQLKNERDLLLHICCAPCAEYPLMFLREEVGLEPTGYFYNPNIHPLKEHQRRLDTLRDFAASVDLRLIVRTDFEEGRWRNFPTKSKADHCGRCYATRFDETARLAAELGFTSFSSTLFVSPYQDYDRMADIARSAARRHDVLFREFDFRPGFRRGQEMAVRDGLYRQKYCGCIYSLGESNMKTKILRDLNLSATDIPDRGP